MPSNWQELELLICKALERIVGERIESGSELQLIRSRGRVKLATATVLGSRAVEACASSEAGGGSQWLKASTKDLL